MMLGAAVSLCIRCQLSPATKRETQLDEQRSQLEGQQRFQVIRSHTVATQRLESVKEPENLPIARKASEELGASHHPGYGSRDESRYQNFLTEKDEDSYSYENVTIGASQGSDPDDTVDYENSMAIQTWKLQQGQASLSESLDDEPDYINTCPGSSPALLSEKR
ncbi:linker for activation of T-cells family member 2 [Turdus rufiventris]|nr:linker for activation of T-cells family member 2 [Turdus rufiventris]